MFEAARVTPYILISSPTKRSGKTRLLEVLELVAREPLRAASVTEAALFQAVEAFRPTLLIDEVDAIFTGRSERAEALRGVLNAGNARGAYVVRGTQDGTPVKFECSGRRCSRASPTASCPTRSATAPSWSRWSASAAATR